MNKMGVYIIGILFISSIFAVAMIEGSGSQKSVELPQNPILQSPLSQNQIILLKSVGGTYAEIKTNLCDFDCIQKINQIEALTTRYTPYFYVYKNTNSNEKSALLENYHGVSNLTGINSDEIESKICEIIPSHPECIKRSAIDALFVTNTSS